MTFSKTVLSSILATLQFADDADGKSVTTIKESAAVSREGRECFPRKKKWRRRLLSSNLDGANNDRPDVGILGRCPTNQVCRADATSSIGGRCFTKASSFTRRTGVSFPPTPSIPPSPLPSQPPAELVTPPLQSPGEVPPTPSDGTMAASTEEKKLCHFTCPDPKVCECVYPSDQGFQFSGFSGVDQTPECIAAMASSCRNGDYAECILNNIDNIAIWKGLYCPIYECIHDGKGYGECLADAYEEYYQFCKDFFLDKTDLDINTSNSYCDEIIEMFETYGAYYFQNVLANPNKFAKKQKLIENRFYECLSNYTSDGVEQYVYYNEGITYAQSYAQYAQYFEHHYECLCQKFSESCELHSKIGIEGEYQSYCIVSNCCNNSIPDGNVTACFNLNDGSYEVITAAPSAMPSSSPSMEASTMKESGKETSLPDRSGNSQNSSASSHSVESLLGYLVWAPTLFATVMGFLVLGQFVT